MLTGPLKKAGVQYGRGFSANVVLLGFAVLGAAPWRRPAGNPDPEPAVLDALGAR